MLINIMYKHYIKQFAQREFVLHCKKCPSSQAFTYNISRICLVYPHTSYYESDVRQLSWPGQPRATRPSLLILTVRVIEICRSHCQQILS